MDITEQAIIVDENDNVVEYRDRRDVGTYDLHRIVAIWITNDQGHVLLAQRALSMSNQPGVWGPAAAGTVAKGEEYIETAYRELSEEVGITDVVLTQSGKFMTDRPFGESRMCAVFTGNYRGELSLQTEEVASIRWMDADDIKYDVAKNPQNYVINMSQVMGCLTDRV